MEIFVLKISNRFLLIFKIYFGMVGDGGSGLESQNRGGKNHVNLIGNIY